MALSSRTLAIFFASTHVPPLSLTIGGASVDHVFLGRSRGLLSAVLASYTFFVIFPLSFSVDVRTKVTVLVNRFQSALCLTCL